MDELKVYTNKNIGSFLSIPASRISKTNNLEDSIYFSRHIKKLQNNSIEQLRSTEHYKSKTQQYSKSLEGIDTTSLKDMSTKLKLNIKMYNPLAKTDSKYKEGGSVRKSYKTIELLQVSKNSFKPMLFLGGTPNAAARSLIGFQQQRDMTPRMTRPQSVKAMRQAPQRATAKSDAFPEYDTTQTHLSLNTSLIEDCMKLFKAAAHENDSSNLSNVISDFMSNPMYDDLHSMWDPTEMIIEDSEEDPGQYGGAKLLSVQNSLRFALASPTILFGLNAILSNDPNSSMVKKIAQGVGLYIIRVPGNLYDKTLVDLNKNIFMVLLAKGGDKSINDKSVRKVGIVMSSKNTLKEIDKLTLSQKWLLKWLRWTSNPQKWAETISDQIRSKISPDDFKKLRRDPSNKEEEDERYYLIEKLKANLQHDQFTLDFLQQISAGGMDDKSWEQFQNYASIPSSSIKYASLQRYKMLSAMYCLYFLIFIFITWYSMYPGLSGLSDEKSFQRFGKVSTEIYANAVPKTIEKFKLKNSVMIWGILQLFKVGNWVSGDLVQTGLQYLGFEYMNTKSSQLQPNDAPIDRTVINTIEQLEDVYGLNSQHLQEAIRDECIGDISRYAWYHEDPLLPFQKEWYKEVQHQMISTYIKCEFFLTKNYKTAVYEKSKKHRSIFGNEYYGSHNIYKFIKAEFGDSKGDRFIRMIEYMFEASSIRMLKENQLQLPE